MKIIAAILAAYVLVAYNDASAQEDPYRRLQREYGSPRDNVGEPPNPGRYNQQPGQADRDYQREPNLRYQPQDNVPGGLQNLFSPPDSSNRRRL